MEVLYHGIKTRYAYDFPLCFSHELIMSLRNIFDLHEVMDVGLVFSIKVTIEPAIIEAICVLNAVL